MIDRVPEFKKEYKIIIILLLASLVLGIISFIVSPSNGKKNNKKDYVYTAKTTNISSNIKSYLPVINLRGSRARKINKELKSIYNDKKNLLNYQYSISGDYLSFVYYIITIEDNLPHYEIKTVVLNLLNRKQVSQDELLKIYGITEDSVREKINKQMENLYYHMISDGYIDEHECDYNCFLKDRDFDSKKALQLTIEDSKLIAYQAFTVYGIYGEENYFKEEDFRFEIADQTKE